MILIVYTHPSHESHNGKILKQVTKALDNRHKKYEVIDLYKDNFQGYFSHQEYDRLRNRDLTLEKEVIELQAKIKSADTLIFIYPTWWYNMPARLKGFMDRVFTNGFAYRFKRVNSTMMLGAWLLSFIPGIRYLMQPLSAEGYLKGKKAIIFRTYGGPKLGKRVFGNKPAALEESILRFCGITNIKTHELFNIDKKAYTQAYEDQYMNRLTKICKTL